MDPEPDLVWAAEVYRDGDLDQAQARALADRLRRDPQARTEFLGHLRQAQYGDLVMRSDAEDAAVVARLLDSVREDRAAVRAAMGRRAPLPLLRLAMGLAALVAIVVGVGNLMPSGPETAPALSGGRLIEDTVRITAQGEIHRRWADGSTVALADQTEAILRRDGGLDLRRGSVRCQVAKQAPDRTWSVDTPYGQVVVVGTRFTVQVDARRMVLVVEEGLVDVHPLRGAPIPAIQAGEALALDAAGGLHRGVPGDLWQTIWRTGDADFLSGRLLGGGRYATQETDASQRNDAFAVERYLQFAPPHHGLGTTPLFTYRKGMRVHLNLEVETPVRLWLTWQMQEPERNFAIFRNLPAGRQEVTISTDEFSDREHAGLEEGMEVMWYGIWIAEAPDLILHSSRIDAPISTATTWSP